MELNVVVISKVTSKCLFRFALFLFNGNVETVWTSFVDCVVLENNDTYGLINVKHAWVREEKHRAVYLLSYILFPFC